MSRLTRDGTAEPVSRDQILRHARGQGNIIFPVQLTTSRVGNLTRLIHTLLYVMTIHTYIHTYEHRIGTGTGTGTEARTVAEMGTGTTITGTRIGLGRAEGRQKSTRSRKIAVDAARETGETWVESEKNVEKKGLVQ